MSIYWYWTDARLETRYKKLEKLMGDKRDNYTIHLIDCSIEIRNIKTMEGIETDSLQHAKQWIKKNMEENNK